MNKSNENIYHRTRNRECHGHGDYRDELKISAVGYNAGFPPCFGSRADAEEHIAKTKPWQTVEVVELDLLFPAANPHGSTLLDRCKGLEPVFMEATKPLAELMAINKINEATVSLKDTIVSVQLKS